MLFYGWSFFNDKLLANVSFLFYFTLYDVFKKLVDVYVSFVIIIDTIEIG
jgi:hypothetical protein